MSVPHYMDDQHYYLSTGCLHNRHDYCNAMTGMQGVKRPARCKFCDSQCICPCHYPANADKFYADYEAMDRVLKDTVDDEHRVSG